MKINSLLLVKDRIAAYCPLPISYIRNFKPVTKPLHGEHY
jgi:hypothetical protein